MLLFRSWIRSIEYVDDASTRTKPRHIQVKVTTDSVSTKRTMGTARCFGGRRMDENPDSSPPKCRFCEKQKNDRSKELYFFSSSNNKKFRTHSWKNDSMTYLR